MKQIKCGVWLLLSVLMLALMIPTATLAAEPELSTEFISIQELDGEIVATYDTKEGSPPDQILYAVTRDGQFVWDGAMEIGGVAGKQECILDIPAQSFQRNEYDIVIWGERETDEGTAAASRVFAFRVVMGNGKGTIDVPKIQHPKTMIVRVPFAYIASDSSMNDSICYLKCGDTVQVYTDAEDNAILYVAKGNVGGFMYSRALVSKVFDFAGIGNEAIVEVALSQVGNQGGEPYWSWYGFSSRVEWCACFVSWAADQCGFIEQGIIPKFAACTSQGMPWFIERGQWSDRNAEPLPGYIIFFDWDNSQDADHVGIVEKCENGVVYTIEGNSGDACKQRSYPVGSSEIRGYGIPAY